MFLKSWSGMGPSTVDRDRKLLAVVLVLDIKTIFFENHNKWFVLPVLVTSHHMFVHIIFVRFMLLSGHLLGKSYSLG